MDKEWTRKKSNKSEVFPRMWQEISCLLIFPMNDLRMTFNSSVLIPHSQFMRPAQVKTSGWQPTFNWGVKVHSRSWKQQFRIQTATFIFGSSSEAFHHITWSLSVHQIITALTILPKTEISTFVQAPSADEVYVMWLNPLTQQLNGLCGETANN